VTETAAFDESLPEMKAAEAFGFDAVWLAEIHFQRDRSVLAAPSSSPPPWQRARSAIGIAVQAPSHARRRRLHWPLSWSGSSARGAGLQGAQDTRFGGGV